MLLFSHRLILYTGDFYSEAPGFAGVASESKRLLFFRNGPEDMRRRFSGLISLAVSISIVALLPTASAGQTEPKPKRLHAPATVRGLTGGEGHEAYVIRVPKGRSLSVEISWRSEDNNTASFGVGTNADFEPVTFGKESADGKKWSGRVPRTADYFIEVMAHPRAHYVLKVAIK